MQLKPQDSVACVFASFDVIMLFDYFHTPAGQSMPIISPLLLALDYGWIPIRMSPGAVLCVHGCPWASIHGCPWCPWVSIQATAARCKMYRQPLPLCWTPRTTAPFRWMSSRSGVWRSNRTQTGNRVFILCIGYWVEGRECLNWSCLGGVLKECGGLSTSENGEELVHRDCQGLCRVLSSDAWLIPLFNPPIVRSKRSSNARQACWHLHWSIFSIKLWPLLVWPWNNANLTL